MVFFFGRLRVPTRRCDLVVPADWGWGRSNQNKEKAMSLPCQNMFLRMSQRCYGCFAVLVIWDALVVTK